VGALAGVVFSALVVEALAAGEASPEATRTAIGKMQRIRRGEVRELLEGLVHPFGPKIPRSRPDAPMFRERANWAFFQHWGGVVSVEE
jgi:hypothetical protein